MIQRSNDPVLFFSTQERRRIIEAIRQAERQTSGEIRVHLERKAKTDITAHAKEVFERLGMTRTDARNGVLFFLGVASHRFAILGDIGIHERIPEGFWDELAAELSASFQEDRFADGLVSAIQTIGEALRTHFPCQRNDLNELPDELSFSA